jgi:hypothetical protein
MLDSLSTTESRYSAGETTGKGEGDLGEARIVALLRHHYGDGGVYVPEGGARAVFLEASRLGFINEDGYLTRKGRQLLAQHGD